MNWHMIISGLIVVVIKIVGMTLFLHYFPQIFGKSNVSLIPTESYGTGFGHQKWGAQRRCCVEPGGKCSRRLFGDNTVKVPQTFGSSNASFILTESYGTVCPRGWDFHQGRCFFLSTSESSWNKSRDFCEGKGSTLAIVNTPEKLNFLQKITGAEKYFIGLLYQHTEKRWRWINNSVFNGNVTNQYQDFNCVTIGLTKTYDAASCDINYHWICEKNAK